MPRYFFHFNDGQETCDNEGSDLPSVEVAQTEAVRYAGELLTSSAMTFWNGEGLRVEVADEKGETLFTLGFTGAMKMAGTRAAGMDD